MHICIRVLYIIIYTARLNNLDLLDSSWGIIHWILAAAESSLRNPVRWRGQQCNAWLLAWCLVPVPVQQYLVPSSTGTRSVVVFNLRQYLRPVPSAVHPNRCRRRRRHCHRRHCHRRLPTQRRTMSCWTMSWATVLAHSNQFLLITGFYPLDFYWILVKAWSSRF